MRTSRALILLAVIGGACAAIPAPADGFTFEPAFTETPCPGELADHPRISCGLLLIDDAKHGGNWRHTRLAVAIVHAAGPARADPIVFMHGGPGSQIVRYSAGAFENNPMSRDRDVIVMDERGSGLSRPFLWCNELDRLELASPRRPDDDPASLREQSQAKQRCKRRLTREGSDPDAVTTKSIAGDFAALRTALRIREWNVVGFSFGGRVALAMLRDHPEGIRSMVLNAPAPLGESLFDVRRGRSAIQELFAACNASPSCAARHPDLQGEWSRRLRALDESPAEIVVPATSEHPDVTVLVDSTRAVQAVIGVLDNPEARRTLPDVMMSSRFLDAVAHDLIEGGRPLDEGETPVPQFAVVCHEDLASRGPVSPAPEALGYPERAGVWHVCDGWKTARATTRELASPKTRVPTLILYGQFDTAVPRAWVTKLADRIDAQLVEFPDLGHGVISGRDPPCGRIVVVSFLDAPTAQAGTSCIPPPTPLP